MLSLLSLCVLFLHLITALVIDTSPEAVKQQALNAAISRPPREYPLGGSPFYYVGSPEYQIFRIDYLKLTPDPIEVNEIFFLYMMGELGDYPGLLDTNLKIVWKNYTTNGLIVEPGRVTYEAPLDTNHWYNLAIRPPLDIAHGPSKNLEYLVPGRLELVVDWVFIDLKWLKENSVPGDTMFEFHATLPDGRTLFHLEGPIKIVDSKTAR